MYVQMETGLSPEIVHFNMHQGSTRDIEVKVGRDSAARASTESPLIIVGMRFKKFLKDTAAQTHFLSFWILALPK